MHVLVDSLEWDEIFVSWVATYWYIIISSDVIDVRKKTKNVKACRQKCNHSNKRIPKLPMQKPPKLQFSDRFFWVPRYSGPSPSMRNFWICNRDLYTAGVTYRVAQKKWNCNISVFLSFIFPKPELRKYKCKACLFHFNTSPCILQTQCPSCESYTSSCWHAVQKWFESNTTGKNLIAASELPKYPTYLWDVFLNPLCQKVKY